MELTEEKLNYLAEAMPGSKAIYQIRGAQICALYLSPALHTAVGMDSGEFERRARENAADTVLPADLPPLMEQVQACVRTHRPMQHYWRVVHPRQGFIWVHGSASYCGEYGGCPVLLVTYGTDLTEVDLYKDVVDNSQTMAYVCDCSTYEILYANKAAMEYWGHADAPPLGLACYSYIHGRTAPCEDCFMKTVRPGEMFSRDRFNEYRGVWERLSGKCITWCGRCAFIQYITDITDLVRGQHQLQELVYLHSQQLEATQILNEQGDIAPRIQAALQKMQQYYEADRTYIFLIDEGGQTLSNTYECCREGIAPQIGVLQHGDIHYIDRWLPVFARQEVFVQKSIEDIRESDPYEYSIMAPQGIRAYIEAPIIANGALIGFIGADNPPAEKFQYSPDLLLSFAYSVGNAIIRAQNEQKIQKHTQELEAVINNIPVGVSMSRIRDGRAVSKLTNPLLCDLYGVPAESGGAEQFDLDRIQEPYRTEVSRKLRALLEPGGSVHADFPYRRDGAREPRWYRMNSRSVCFEDEILNFSCLSDITEEKLAEAEREKARRMYEAAVEAANIVVWEYDIPSHRIIMAENDFTEYDYRKFGLPKVTENAPASLLPYIDERYVKPFLEMYDAVEHGAPKASCEVWYKVMPGREPRCEHISYTTIFGKDGRPVSAMGIGVNVTARKQEEEKYRLFYKQMMEANPNTLGSFRLNLTKNLCGDGQSALPAYLALQESGTASGFLLAISELVGPGEQKDRFCRMFSRASLLKEYQQGHSQHAAELRFAASAGSVVWARAAVNMVQNPMTGDVEAIVFLQDITERKKRDEIDQRLTNEIIDYIGLIDLTRHTFEFTNVNMVINALPVGKKLDYDVCIGYDLRTFVAPEDRELFRQSAGLDHIVGELGAAPDYSFAYGHDEDGKKLRKQLRYSYLNSSHEEILVIQSDITRTYRTEQEQLQRLQEALRSAEIANAAKTDFLSRMSHDIRTPLNGIIGMTYLARREREPDRIDDCLNKIDTSSKFLLGLINDILDMSKAESGMIDLHPEPYPPAEFAAYMNAVIMPLIREKNQTLDLDIRVPEDFVPLQDKLRVNQVVFNILSNAVKFTPEGGRIRYAATGTLTPDGAMLLRAEISDNGVGMSEAFQRILFDPFTQENRDDNSSGRGTGLGMAITKRLLDLMGGSIRVQSTLGRGSTFVIEILSQVVPAARAAGQPGAGSGPDADYSALAGRHVLLCEDHPLNQEIAKALLAGKGVITSAAEDGKKGVEAFGNSPPRFFDAILMDIRMPVMDGYEATAAIRAMDRPDAKSVPIIAMTADAFSDDVKKCLAVGMDGHVAKPIDPEHLFAALSGAILRNSK